MGSILLGDLDDRLTDKLDIETAEDRQKLAAGRLSLLMLVMAATSLGGEAEAAAEESKEQRPEVRPQRDARDFRRAG